MYIYKVFPYKLFTYNSISYAEHSCLFLCSRSICDAPPVHCCTAPSFWGASCLPASHCCRRRDHTTSQTYCECIAFSCWKWLNNWQNNSDKALASKHYTSNGAGCKFCLREIANNQSLETVFSYLHMGYNGKTRSL